GGVRAGGADADGAGGGAEDVRTAPTVGVAGGAAAGAHGEALGRAVADLSSRRADRAGQGCSRFGDGHTARGAEATVAILHYNRVSPGGQSAEGARSLVTQATVFRVGQRAGADRADGDAAGAGA